MFYLPSLSPRHPSSLFLLHKLASASVVRRLVATADLYREWRTEDLGAFDGPRAIRSQRACVFRPAQLARQRQAGSTRAPGRRQSQVQVTGRQDCAIRRLNARRPCSHRSGRALSQTAMSGSCRCTSARTAPTSRRMQVDRLDTSLVMAIKYSGQEGLDNQIPSLYSLRSIITEDIEHSEKAMILSH